MSDLPAKKEQFKVSGYNFTETEFKIIQANQSVTVKRKPKLDMKQAISIAIRAGIQVMGHNEKSSNEMKFMIDTVYDYMCRSLPNTKSEELILAIELGSIGEYDNDVVYMSVKSIIKWIKTYLNRKINTIQTLSLAKEKEALKIAESNKAEKRKDYWKRFPEMVDTEFQYWRANNELSESADRICECLNEIGYLSTKKNGFLGDVVDVDLKKVWKKDVEEKEKYRLGKYDVIRTGPMPLIVYHDEITIDGFAKKVINTCMKMALEYWFKTVDAIDKDGIKVKIEENEELH
jgi:hypothetical protein